MSDSRETLRQACRADEAACVARLAGEWASVDYDRAAAQAQARQLVAGARAERRQHSGVDHLMHEFPLSSAEGMALMCLAEALLRIPDTATVDRLIRDKIRHGDWQAHLGGSGPVFVHAAAWGLLLTGRLVDAGEERRLGEHLGRLLRRGGEPLVRRAIAFALRRLGHQFVAGEDIESALARARHPEARGYRHSFDMLGEAALTRADAERYTTAYETVIHAIGQQAAGVGVQAGPGISVKLSALHPRYTRSQRARVMAELLPRLLGLCELAAHYAIGLNIDAEEADRLELSLDLFTALVEAPTLAGWAGLGFVVQAYQKRAPAVIELLQALARQHGRRLMVRLVKGAYWDSEIKRAQVDGLADYPVFTRKAHTDLSYLVCARRLLAAADDLYPQFATHNAHTLATVQALAQACGVQAYEFQRLHGMGEALYDQVVGGAGTACRIYAPVGTHRTLLPYLVRRLLENGANNAFVHRLVDPAVPVAALVEDPLEAVARTGGGRHPAIPLPRDLYGNTRENSAGLDLEDEGVIAATGRALSRLAGRYWLARPLVPGIMLAGEGRMICNPARQTDAVGEVIDADAPTVARALDLAAAAAPRWHACPPARRAAILRRAAELLESRRERFLSLAVREAGKTWGNAAAELREAVDFCRYYGQQLENGHFHPPPQAPGPVVCISPWNFPLAIFVGQVVAALAAGSPVLAKPAGQTPLIAAQAVHALHAAGVPAEVLHFLPGPGEVVGRLLLADPRVLGVLFTGSTAVARHIQQAIAIRPGVRLIAETGGQNAMIVDASALPEQVVQDVLRSAFDSAGQRCSALRVLCLQEEIAESTLELLRAAMQEQTLGDPGCLESDIGPVIDPRARAALLAHVEALRRRGRPVFQVALPAECAAGSFFPPTLIDIETLDELKGEVFGPVVHVLRFAAGREAALVAALNATGYGLTLGLQSRIDEMAVQLRSTANVGNIYVNRNMVGAVVGVQPFGGEGLSGTGPKAGGPLYLHRLAGTAQVSPAMLGEGGRRAPPQADAALPGPLEHLREWADARGETALAQRCRDYAALTLLGCTLHLPGPAGESNILEFAPRGRMLCLADDEPAALAQLAAVLATGNVPLLPDDARRRAWCARWPRECAIVLQPVGDYRGVAGVLLPAGGEHRALRQALAGQSGPLIPVYDAQATGRDYPLYRLLLERVVSINTAAVGGNTALMTLVS